MIIGFEDGSQRALGSCRLGIDMVEKCPRLEEFHFVVEQVGSLPKLRVEVRPRSQAGNAETSWTTLVAGAKLELWFVEKAAAMYQYKN